MFDFYKEKLLILECLIQVERLILGKCIFYQWLWRRLCCRSGYTNILETWI